MPVRPGSCFLCAPMLRGRTDLCFDDDRCRAGTSIAEVLSPRGTRGGDILRTDEIGGDFNEIRDAHPGVGEDRDNVPPAGLSLCLDIFGHGSIRQHADLARYIEKPRALGHLDRMAIGAERRGHRSWSTADIHVSDPSIAPDVGWN